MKVRFLLARLLNKTNITAIYKDPNLATKDTIYSFLFVSLISPSIAPSLRFFFEIDDTQRKLALKQSYILLTWFYYVTFLNNENKKKILKFFVLPIRRSTYTQLRTPMAHKTWSKEQYKFQYFLIRISFYNKIKFDTLVESVNYALLFVLLSKKNFPIFETNLLFLKNYWFTFCFKDKIFFSYYRYLL